MNDMIAYAWLVPAFPFISFLLIGLGVRLYSQKLAGMVATVSVGASAVSAYAVALSYFNLLPDAQGLRPTLIPWRFAWVNYMEGLRVDLGVLIDPISVLLMVVVTTVSFLVHLYSMGYMHGESGYGRYFTWLNLFTFSMLGLVVAPNIIQTYVFWELVGASSFLLIGYYYQRGAAVSASKKAFIVTRFADLGFLLGIILLGWVSYPLHQGSGLDAQLFDFAFLTHPSSISSLAASGFLGVALLLIYMGAAGKSAMFPLHIWLPDAMEGPTPVSALIHAATMVVAGVYLVARLFPLFSAAPDVLEFVSYVGLFTCAFAAIIACTQSDIKRVLAFSTLSQLGYMMFALGIASMDQPLGYVASMFHLFTHAFFKALLFLGAGAIIHAVHSNNVWQMGGLKKLMPFTHLTFLIAVLAISGIWPFAGFFSKDEILLAALQGGKNIHFYGGLFVAGLTAFYMARIYFLSFWGSPRSQGSSHAHEAPWVMLIPLMVLAILSLVAGWLPFSHYVNVGSLEHQAGHSSIVPIAGSAVAVLGLVLSWFIYGSGLSGRSDNIAQKCGFIFTWIKNKFYIDEVYQFITHKIIFRFVATPIAWFDRNVVDGAVNLTGWMTRKSSGLLTLLQTGQAQTYGVWFVLGAGVTLIMLWYTKG